MDRVILGRASSCRAAHSERALRSRSGEGGEVWPLLDGTGRGDRAARAVERPGTSSTASRRCRS